MNRLLAACPTQGEPVFVWGNGRFNGPPGACSSLPVHRSRLYGASFTVIVPDNHNSSQMCPRCHRWSRRNAATPSCVRFNCETDTGVDGRCRLAEPRRHRCLCRPGGSSPMPLCAVTTATSSRPPPLATKSARSPALRQPGPPAPLASPLLRLVLYLWYNRMPRKTQRR
jgi:hypothetical protein